MTSATSRAFMRSPREIDLCRFTSYLGHTSQKPVSELLISSHASSIVDPVKLNAMRNCLDGDSFDSCSIPSLELFSQNGKDTESTPTLQGYDNHNSDQLSNSRTGGEEDSSKVTDESDSEDRGAITNAKSKLAEVDPGTSPTKDSASDAAGTGNEGMGQQVTDTAVLPTHTSNHVASTNRIEHIEGGAHRPIHNSFDFSPDSVENLTRPVILSGTNIHEAPTKMLRGIGLSFNKLIDSRVKAWVDRMLSKSFNSDEEGDERQVLLSLMTISDAITLVKASTSLQALPAILPNLEKHKGQGRHVVLLPIVFNSVLYFEMSGEEAVAKIQCPGTIMGTFNSKSERLQKVELDLDSTVLLASMLEQANSVALRMISVAATEALNTEAVASRSFEAAGDPEITSRLVRNGSYAADQYSGAAMAQVPTLKRSMHLCPSSDDMSKAKRIESKLGLVRNNTSYNHIGSGESLKKKVQVNATFDGKLPSVMSSALALSKKRSAVTWTDLSDTDNTEREIKRTKNAGWGSAILKNREIQSCTSMKRTISSGASTIVRSMKSSKNATFADFGRVGSNFKNTGSSTLSFTQRNLSSGLSSSSFSRLRRPQSTSRSFTDLKRPAPGSLVKLNANATFDIPSSDNARFKQNRFLSMGLNE